MDDDLMDVKRGEKGSTVQVRGKARRHCPSRRVAGAQPRGFRLHSPVRATI